MFGSVITAAFYDVTDYESGTYRNLAILRLVVRCGSSSVLIIVISNTIFHTGIFKVFGVTHANNIF